MGLTYRAIHWNRNKKSYDAFMVLGITVVLVVFIALQLLVHHQITIETLIIRATGFVAILLLHIVLIIGPLSRLSSLFLPLLYNRRHLGVTMFLFALTHGVFSIIQFHSLGDTNAIESVFTSNQNYLEISDFPFQILGFLALVILSLMGLSSHDFWLKQLSPRFWKSLHMSVYFAYALIFAHVALGTLQYEDHPIYWFLLVLGFVCIGTLHLFTGWRTYRTRAMNGELASEGLVKVCGVSEIETDHAKTIFIADQNIAIFKYDGKISAVNNMCRHQLGPLGEGKIIDGCITCPWHGYQYRPEDGQSPPPFTERIATYRVKIVDDTIWVDPRPNPEGTFSEPASFLQ